MTILKNFENEQGYVRIGKHEDGSFFLDFKSEKAMVANYSSAQYVEELLPTYQFYCGWLSR